MEMAKLVLFHKLLKKKEFPRMERWFQRYHVPEVMQQTPWMVRYAMFRPVPFLPKEAEAFNIYNFRVHENWALGPDLRRPPRGALSMSREPVEEVIEGAGIQVPAVPTEDFMEAFSFEEHPILRWVCMFRYPEGVSVEEGDDWYLNVHAPEVMKQNGLNRFLSYKGYPQTGMLVPHKPRADGSDVRNRNTQKVYHRLSELWYEDTDGWLESVIKNPPSYTRPPWAVWDQYPFLEPGVDFASTFLLEKPEAVYTQSASPIIW